MAYWHSVALSGLQDPDRLTIVCRRARQTLHAWQRNPGARAEAREVNQEDADDADASDSANYIPTPEEIRQRCEEVQRKWSRLERQRRIVRHDNPVELLALCVKYHHKGYPAAM